MLKKTEHWIYVSEETVASIIRVAEVRGSRFV
jgi:hypothetical protein